MGAAAGNRCVDDDRVVADVGNRCRGWRCRGCRRRSHRRSCHRCLRCKEGTPHCRSRSHIDAILAHGSHFVRPCKGSIHRNAPGDKGGPLAMGAPALLCCSSFRPPTRASVMARTVGLMAAAPGKRALRFSVWLPARGSTGRARRRQSLQCVALCKGVLPFVLTRANSHGASRGFGCCGSAPSGGRARCCREDVPRGKQLVQVSQVCKDAFCKLGVQALQGGRRNARKLQWLEKYSFEGHTFVLGKSSEIERGQECTSEWLHLIAL
jgi:hypothetical protein